MNANSRKWEYARQAGLVKQCRPRSSVIYVSTVSRSVCIFWMHYFRVKFHLDLLLAMHVHCSVFRIMRCSQRGGYLFPCSPEINRFVPLHAKIKILISWCLFPSFLDLCSAEIKALIHIPQNPWEGLNNHHVFFFSDVHFVFRLQ